MRAGSFRKAGTAKRLLRRASRWISCRITIRYRRKLVQYAVCISNRPPHAQAKLVRCGRGCLLDVVVDIRRGSPTYGKWLGEELSDQNGRQLLIPAGFLHGFITRAPDTEIIYKCTDYYAPACDGAVRFDDPDIGIDWGLPAGVAPILSDKDAAAPLLRDLASPFIFEG